jgi:hypothetical protein
MSASWLVKKSTSCRLGWLAVSIPQAAMNRSARSMWSATLS